MVRLNTHSGRGNFHCGKVTRDEFPEVLKAFATDSRLAGAMWAKIADTFPDPAKFILVIMTPDRVEYCCETIAEFHRLLDGL